VTITKITAALFAALSVVSFVLWNTIGLINFSASFIGFLLVAAASFLGYKRVVSASKDVQKEPSDEQEEDDEEDEQKQSKTAVLLKTYKGWIFPFRLIAYAIFVLIFLYFANNNILHVFAFLSGIAVLPISALIFVFFFRREF
jgi:hypothetical protein